MLVIYYSQLIDYNAALVPLPSGERLQCRGAGRGTAAHQGEFNTQLVFPCSCRDLLTFPHPTISSPSIQQTRKAQKEVEFLGEVGEGTVSMQELRAAHAETIQELQKTRNILNTESNISKHLQVAALSSSTHPAPPVRGLETPDVSLLSLPRQVELDTVLRKTEGDRAEHQRKLERQARLLDARAAKIHKLEGLSSFLSVCLLSSFPSVPVPVRSLFRLCPACLSVH